MHTLYMKLFMYMQQGDYTVILHQTKHQTISCAKVIPSEHI